MKTQLRISILFHLVLLGSLTFVLWNGRKPSAEIAVQAIAGSCDQVKETVAEPPNQPTPAAGPKSFRWSQLESTNYPVYINNLRSIGCPKPTLRAIVAADAEAVFRQRRQVLEKKLADLAGQSWSVQLGAFQTEAEWKAELQRLPDEETMLINDLLDDQAAPALTGTAIAANDRQRKNEALCPLPLVLQAIDPAALDLTTDQIQVINELSQRFVDIVGGSNQDPNDPAYLERWQQAQPEADEMLRGLLGTSFFQNYQLATAGNGQSQTTGQP